MMSPSRTSAIGPQCALSGPTCPTQKPRVAPENRPSVINATFLPIPWPDSAAVVASISRMPGPPAGPSFLMTMTSPSSYARSLIAANASSSHSKTRAGPENTIWSSVMPAIFTMAPSGARLPFNPTTPPVVERGVETGWMTLPSASRSTRSISSPIVLPVATMQSSWMRPTLRSSLSTTGTPPAS